MIPYHEGNPMGSFLTFHMLTLISHLLHWLIKSHYLFYYIPFFKQKWLTQTNKQRILASSSIPELFFRLLQLNINPKSKSSLFPSITHSLFLENNFTRWGPNLNLLWTSSSFSYVLSSFCFSFSSQNQPSLHLHLHPNYKTLYPPTQQKPQMITFKSKNKQKQIIALILTAQQQHQLLRHLSQKLAPKPRLH